MRSWPRSPRIVAESLTKVEEPAVTLVGRTLPGTSATFHAALAAALMPGRSAATPPSFLQLHQVESWRRLMHALSHYGGALLVEPTGSGKSWIALACAHGAATRPLIIAPAVLLPQWEATSRAAGVPVDLWSHERCSRGTAPPSKARFVIIDEAHRFRDAGTRRVNTIAPWLAGKRTLLLTATPIVNRTRDLLALLRLIVPDDALALDGIGALSGLEACPAPLPGVRRLVIRSAHRLTHAARTVVRLLPNGAEDERGSAAIATINQLTLSRNVAIRRLLRTMLLDAAASSNAALQRSLIRYRALLLQARDAGGISRAAVRRFAGESLDQLVFWELTGTSADSELALDDIAAINPAATEPRADLDWMNRLQQETGALEVAVCFTRHRATAHALRRYWADDAAWVTGSEAGVGPHRLPRATVLDAFGPGRPDWRAFRRTPRLLIATDVAAEGLDLQAAEGIVHLDLPWTATRMAQREGRLLRIGQLHAQVRILVRHPPRVIEGELAGRGRIRRKRSTSERWLAALRAPEPCPDSAAPLPVTWTVEDNGISATLVVLRATRDNREGCWLVARTGGGNWTTDIRLIAALLDRAKRASHNLDNSIVPDCRPILANAVQFVIGNVAGNHAGPPALLARIQRLARAAAARRDGTALTSLDRLLRFAGSAQPLGGRMALEQIVALSDDALLSVVVPEIQRPGPVALSVVAALHFPSVGSRLR